MSWPEDRGLRTTFADQPYVHVDEEETDNESTEKVIVKKGQVYTIPPDRQTLTPDFVAIRGQRALFSNGGMCNINIAHIQEQYDAGKSMRSEIKKHESHQKNYFGTDTNEQVKPEHEPERKIKEKIVKRNKVGCIPRLVALILVASLFFSGLVLLIYFKKESEPEGQRGTVITPEEETGRSVNNICPDVTVNLRGIISFNCSMKSVQVPLQDINYVHVTPPPYWNKGSPFNIPVEEQEKNTNWNANLDIYNNSRILHVRGPEASCSSGGLYQLEIRNKQNRMLANATVSISVRSEVLRVNVSLRQDKDGGNSDFTLGCTTNSGCEQSFVDFFAEINKKEQQLRGVNFSCIISYNDFDGYTVSCLGVIPDYLMSQFEKITCRPRSSLLDDLDKDDLEDLEAEIELPECDLTKHCGYECQNDGDYYVVSRQRCDIFHRCFKKQVFTSYCAPGTFFDPNIKYCACRHTKDLSWCQQNGALKPGSDVSDESCT